MTSTMANLMKNGQYQLSIQPGDIPDVHNPYATEPFYNQAEIDSQGWANPHSTVNYLQWKVEADLGEMDHEILAREDDGDYEHGGAKKKSGWKNPLAKTDCGCDDDLILFQT